jgi:hypothetical protein
MLSNLGLIRSTDSLDDLLNVCQAVSLSQEPLFGWQSPKQHIVNDLENIHSVNPVKLMAQGFTGKGLGEELKKAQIESIRSDAG